MKRIFNFLAFTPHVLLVLTYGWHGVANLMGGEEYQQTISVLGLSESVNTGLLIFAGLLDCFIAVILVFKERILPRIHWVWLFLYTGFWPIIPRVLQSVGGAQFAWTETIIFLLISFLAAYNYHAYENRKNLRTA